MSLRLLLLFALLGAQAQAKPRPSDAPWAVPDAPFRVLVQNPSEPTDPAHGYAIHLPHFGLARPDLSDLLLLSPDNQPVPLAKIAARPGNPALLLARDLKPNTTYFLYFGGDKLRQNPEWSPRVSLLMETKPAPADLSFDSLAALRAAWERSPEKAGANFMPRIYEGGNPFGPSQLFLTRYTGYLRISQPKRITFYTLSSDCSFVVLNEKEEFGWPGRHSPFAFESGAQKKTIDCPPGLMRVDYYAAKGEVSEEAPLQAATVLGWNESGRFDTVPPEAWAHPGTTKVSHVQWQGRLLPTPKLKVTSFFGHGNPWFYEASYELLRSEDCKVVWSFPDGAVLSSTSGRRIISGEAPLLVRCQVVRQDTTLNLLVRADVPEHLQRTSVNDPQQTRSILQAIAAEASLSLNEKTLQARINFLNDYATDRELATFANSQREDKLWLPARLAGIRILGQSEPRKALQELNSLEQRLTPALRGEFSRDFASTEMDLLVFGIRNSDALPRLHQIAFRDPFEGSERLAQVRTGDLQRLLGNFKQAIAQYQSVAEERKRRPVNDAAESIAVRDLLQKGFQREAHTRLLVWEQRHPTTKFESDFLLLRARNLLEMGRWGEAQVELESYLQIQPDTPFRIDAQFYLGRVQYEKGEKEAARVLWRKIIEQYPKHPITAEAKAWADKP